jgi:enterochelin esterase-like enzyme
VSGEVKGREGRGRVRRKDTDHLSLTERSNSYIYTQLARDTGNSSHWQGPNTEPRVSAMVGPQAWPKGRTESISKC